jgi:hypothetical protein
VAGFYEHGNELSVIIKSGKFLDQLTDSQLFSKDCTPWR